MNDTVFRGMLDASTTVGFIGTGATLLGWEGVARTCGQVKMPLMVPFLFQQGYPLSGVLVSCGAFQKITRINLGRSFNFVSTAQQMMVVSWMCWDAGSQVWAPKEKTNRLEQGAVCVRYGLMLFAGGLQVLSISPQSVMWIKLAAGGIGTGRIIWKRGLRSS